MTRLALLLALVVAAPAWAQEIDPAPPAGWQLHEMLGAGGAFHELYDIPYGTASLFVRVGADHRHFGLYGEVIGEAGAALPRLPIEHVRAGVLMQYINGRFRVGAGVRLGGIIVERATGARADSGFTTSAYAMGSIDVVRWSRRALYAGVEVGFDFIAFPANREGDAGRDVSPSVALQFGWRL